MTATLAPTITICLVADLSEATIKDCKRLTLTGRSDMRDGLTKILHYKSPQVHNISMKEHLKTASVVMIHIDDELVAWALIRVSSINAKVFFFVSEDYRRQGLGSHLVKEVLEKWPKSEFFGWNKESLQFFMNLPFDFNFSACIRSYEDESLY